MRIIIAGAGEVGTHLAKMLSNENHEIILIDTDEEIEPIAAHQLVATQIASQRAIAIAAVDGVGARATMERIVPQPATPVSYTHLRAHETPEHLVCRLLLEKKK